MAGSVHSLIKHITCCADFKLYNSPINNTPKLPSCPTNVYFINYSTSNLLFQPVCIMSLSWSLLQPHISVSLSQEILQHFPLWHTAQKKNKRYSETSLRINVTGIWIKFQQTRTTPYKQLSFPLTQFLMRVHSNKHFYIMPRSCSLCTRPLSSATVNTL